MKNLTLVFIIAVQLISCNSKNRETANQTNVKINDSISGQAVIYSGILPCADCTGIETVLKIYEGDGTMKSHQFELSSIYKGKSPEKEFVEKGNFNTERGLEDDPDGTIYILNWDKPEQNQVYYGYYSADPKKIYLLDNTKKIIKSKLNYALDLKKVN